VVGQVDQLAPLLGRVGAQTQQHLVARVAAERVEQRLILAAHYDTKTDTLDHVERVPALALAVVVTPLAILAALCGALLRGPVRARGPRALLHLSPWLAVLSGALVFTSLSAGAFAARRSPGALDDGAACAVLVRLVEALAAGPDLRRTEVEVLLFSAEEMAAQGSWVYARERFAAPPSLPTALVNLEIIGQLRADPGARRAPGGGTPSFAGPRPRGHVVRRHHRRALVSGPRHPGGHADVAGGRGALLARSPLR
jgi:hypothetical protein